MILACLITGMGFAANAQGYVDQESVASVLETQGSSLPAERVSWHQYLFRKNDKTTKAMLQHLQAHLDSLPGGMQGHRLEIVELSNRVRSKYMMQRSELIIPDSFPDDFRAYAPFPSMYDAAQTLPKLFVIDKYTQTFGAYENGQLVRWGLISTGHDDDLTPTGRYNFNWKQEYRESSEAPEGEVWKLRWVFNFIAAKGIHVHQYQLPIATPASHGCVRMTEADAAWNYNWSSQWTMKDGHVQEAGTPVIVLNHNPVGLAAHWLSGGPNAVISLVNLPENPMDIPLGSESNGLASW